MPRVVFYAYFNCMYTMHIIILSKALNYVHCISYIVFHISCAMHLVLCIFFYVFRSKHLVLCILLYAYCFNHIILSIYLCTSMHLFTCILCILFYVFCTLYFVTLNNNRAKLTFWNYTLRKKTLNWHNMH